MTANAMNRPDECISCGARHVYLDDYFTCTACNNSMDNDKKSYDRFRWDLINNGDS